MTFELWHIWILISMTLFILEIFIPSFIMFNFGLGAMVSSVMAGLDLSIEMQLIVFGIATLLSFFLIRPFMLKYGYRRSHNQKTNVEAIVGRIGTVSDSIDHEKGTGAVRIDGDVWTAYSSNREYIAKDTLVEIERVDSIILYVKPYLKK